MTTGEAERLLGRHYLFKDLPPDLLVRVIALTVTRTVAQNETLFLKGDPGDALYAIAEGVVRIGVTHEGGREIILNVLEPGDVFGEIALIDGLPRSADAVALTPLRLIVLRRRDFIALMEREPKVAIHLLELLCERVRWISELVEDNAFLDVPARLAKRLVGLATAYGRQTSTGIVIDLKVSQQTLGQLLGTSRETVNKILQGWRQDGLIDVQRQRVTVRDLPAL
ncbi:MAG: Crp/Fnr family transcriptional regulator, partial [Alphaproteobacteria bacterium]